MILLGRGKRVTQQKEGRMAGVSSSVRMTSLVEGLVKEQFSQIVKVKRLHI